MKSQNKTVKASYQYIPLSETRHCPCGDSYTVYNVIDFTEDGTPYVAKRIRLA